MARLQHDFLLLERRHNPYYAYVQHIDSPHAVSIHDDVIRYMADSLAWITTYLPAKRLAPSRGLNLYGPTLIKTDGAPVAGKIFHAWAWLFSCGSSRLQLTGRYTWNVDEDLAEGRYDMIRCHRQELVTPLQTVADYARKVAEGRGRLYLLHLGI